MSSEFFIFTPIVVFVGFLFYHFYLAMFKDKAPFAKDE